MKPYNLQSGTLPVQVNAVVALATVVAKTMHELQIKTQSAQLLHLARYVTCQGAGRFIDMLSDFHSSEVNPNELTINASLLGDVAQHMPKDFNHVKLDIVTLAYNPTRKIEKMRPQPDVADFVKGSDAKAMALRVAELSLVEETMKTVRGHEEEQLRSFMTNSKARMCVRLLGHQLLRTMMNKSSEFTTKAKPGKLDQARTVAYGQLMYD
jgi:hypothetical protein